VTGGTVLVQLREGEMKSWKGIVIVVAVSRLVVLISIEPSKEG